MSLAEYGDMLAAWVLGGLLLAVIFGTVRW